MSLPLPQPRFDAPAYLAWEAGQADKHEYVDGEVFAMAGASDAHVTISLNLAMAEAAFTDAFSSADFAEGAQAFLAKRAPRFN